MFERIIADEGYWGDNYDRTAEINKS